GKADLRAAVARVRGLTKIIDCAHGILLQPFSRDMRHPKSPQAFSIALRGGLLVPLNCTFWTSLRRPAELVVLAHIALCFPDAMLGCNANQFDGGLRVGGPTALSSERCDTQVVRHDRASGRFDELQK